jgi:UV DNA damage endonuclease
MKFGYPCINLSLESRSSKTFRLASYTEERLHETIDANLNGLLEILEFNKQHKLLFFRITSDLIPFASHPVNTYPWQQRFKDKFEEIGRFIKEKDMRISMHPDQFVLINSPKEEIFESSVRELQYHADVLDLMKLDTTAKLQIHVGGVYGDKKAAIERFIMRYSLLPEQIRSRLVIENDDRLFSAHDCLKIHQETGLPILFDNLHHMLNNNGEPMRAAAIQCFDTWKTKDGIPMVDYSSQESGRKTGNHSQTIDLGDFQSFLDQIDGLECDIMFEIKDKETSALKALTVKPK